MTFPGPTTELTHILVVGNLKRSRNWYRDVLGATLTGEYGGTSAVFNFQGAWLLLVTPGGETPDKPGTEFVRPRDPSKISHSITIRVPVMVRNKDGASSRRHLPLSPSVR